METREQWLTTAADLIFADIIEPELKPGEHPGHKYRCSVGFPRGSRKAIAQYWKTTASEDGTGEIFTSPQIADSLAVLEALTHELIHYADDATSGHRNFFARVARAVGLEGKLTATYAGPDLRDTLEAYVDDLLGPIPHAALTPQKSGIKQQRNRQILVQCYDQNCGFKFRAAQSQINRIVNTVCPVCTSYELCDADGVPIAGGA
jgi:hypothetical protein